MKLQFDEISSGDKNLYYVLLKLFAAPVLYTCRKCEKRKKHLDIAMIINIKLVHHGGNTVWYN